MIVSAADSQAPLVIILRSIHFVLKAEQILQANHIGLDVIPVPREISSDCGMAIEFAPADFDTVSALLAAAHIDIARIYMKESGGGYVLINWKKNDDPETDQDS